MTDVLRCAACGGLMTVIPGYRLHPGCDNQARPAELYCTGCGLGPAACGCRTPLLWRPSPAGAIATAEAVAALLGGTVLPPEPEPAPRAPRRPGPKCGGCRHAAHGKGCRALAPSRCQPFAGGMMCGYRPACPCPWRTCKCGTGVLLAAELDVSVRALPDRGEVEVVSVERGGDDLLGVLAVRDLPGGFLACRTLGPGEEPGPGERRAAEHLNEACPELAKCEADPRWLVLRGAA